MHLGKGSLQQLSICTDSISQYEPNVPINIYTDESHCVQKHRHVSKPKAIRNVFIIFLVSGFWHGANWTFIVWGGIHALLFIPLFLRGTNRKNTSDVVAEGRWLPSPRELLQMGWTFSAVTIAWVFFRADNLEHAVSYLTHPFDNPLYGGIRRNWPAILAVVILIMGDWSLGKNYPLPSRKWLRWATYLTIATIILFSWDDASKQFIYFQF